MKGNFWILLAGSCFSVAGKRTALFLGMGLRVGLSAPAAIERVRKMEDTKLVRGYRAEINLEKVGRPVLPASCATRRIV
ncbi:MAG: Lrp/AsnC family transcriptional regulator [Ktedonobacteraceae bacterium]|nr:Lrp/AsnC family transcriptional regulator [Ktedonobacteraceae bacterium]